MDRDSLTTHMHRAAQQWVACARMGDYDEALRLVDEITGYSNALDRLDNPNPWDELKGSPDTSRLGHG